MPIALQIPLAMQVFLAQFVMIFLLGFQSQHIRDGKKLAAAITSFLLGVAGWSVTGIVSTVYHQGMLSTVFLSFVAAGPLAIVFSIWLHEKFNKGDK